MAIGTPGRKDPGNQYERIGGVQVYEYNHTTQQWNTKGSEITSPHGQPDDNFGESVWLSGDGNTLAIGCPGERWTLTVGDNHGFTRIYKYENGDWQLPASEIGHNLDTIGRISGDVWRDKGSGDTVCLSDDGNTVCIGAIGDASTKARIRIFKWREYAVEDQGTGDEDTNPYQKDAAFHWEFPFSSPHADADGVKSPEQDAIDRERIVITEDTSNEYYPRAGNYYWTQVGYDLEGPVYSKKASISLSSDGNIIATGFPGDTSSTGIVRVYNYDSSNEDQTGNGLTQIGQDITGLNTSEHTGRGLCLNDAGDILAVGSPGDPSGTTSGTVKVYSYNNTQDQWIQLGDTITGVTGDNTGYSVCFNATGYVLAVGAPRMDINSLVDTGCVRVYEYNSSNNTWEQIHDDIPGTLDGTSQFGWNVRLNNNGDILAVGSPYTDALNSSGDPVTNTGEAKVYRLV